MSIHPDGRRSIKSDFIHIESVHPEVEFPVRSTDTVFISSADTPSIDAFGRLRVSNPVGLWDSQLQYDLHGLWWENSITNTSGNASVSHDVDLVSAQLTVEASDKVIRQTRYYFRYQPGKSQQIFTTFVLSESSSGLTQKVGYFDDDNGIHISVEDQDEYIVQRSSSTGSPVDTKIHRSLWNVDSMDGNGPSGINLNFEKSQILFIDLEWLGVGRVRVGFVVDGLIYIAHEFLNTNNLSTVYMSTANLPIRYEIEGSASLSGSYTLNAICSQVSSEGGVEFPSGLVFSMSNGTTTRSVSTRLPILSLRPKLTFNSITNRGWIIPDSFSIFTEDDDVLLEVIYGGSLTSGSFSSVNSESISEFDVSATAISGGIVIFSDYISVGDSKKSNESALRSIASRYPIALNISGSHPTSPYTDILSICATSMGVATNSCAALSVKEIR